MLPIFFRGGLRAGCYDAAFTPREGRLQWPITDSSCGTICAETEEIGRIAPMPASAAHAPPHWLGYVAVQDVDAIARQATELGGMVIVPGTEIPGVGRFAVLADPQGAFFAVYAPGSK